MRDFSDATRKDFSFLHIFTKTDYLKASGNLCIKPYNKKCLNSIFPDLKEVTPSKNTTLLKGKVSTSKEKE